MDAFRSVHAYARTIENSVSVMVARAIGRGVATAHMGRIIAWEPHYMCKRH